MRRPVGGKPGRGQTGSGWAVSPIVTVFEVVLVVPVASVVLELAVLLIEPTVQVAVALVWRPASQRHHPLR